MAATSMIDDPYFQKTGKCEKFARFLAKNGSFPRFQPVRLKDSSFTPEYLRINGLQTPLLIEGSDHLHLHLPNKRDNMHECFQQVVQSLGEDTKIKIIEVGNQSEVTNWTVSEYAYYLRNRTDSHKILNAISLEISANSISSRITSPKTVRQLDWIDQIWPLERRQVGDYPSVQKYCLVGMKDSFTDFHIDFGGTSVWYHVLWGRKRFYLIKPTLENFAKFEAWTSSKNQGAHFFGNIAKDECFQIEILPNQTLIIPSGWIHAVFTPEDSLVFGGNFVHMHSILKQLQVHAIELRTNVEKIYRFPHFKQIHFYVLCVLYPIAKSLYKNNTMDKEAITKALGDIEAGESAWHAKCLAEEHVLLEFLFLIKTCEVWSLHYDNEFEKQQFYSAASSVFLSPSQLIDEWWGLVEAVARYHCRSEHRDALVARVLQLRAMNQFDCLNSSCLDFDKTLSLETNTFAHSKSTSIDASEKVNGSTVPDNGGSSRRINYSTRRNRQVENIPGEALHSCLELDDESLDEDELEFDSAEEDDEDEDDNHNNNYDDDDDNDDDEEEENEEHTDIVYKNRQSTKITRTLASSDGNRDRHDIKREKKRRRQEGNQKRKKSTHQRQPLLEQEQPTLRRLIKSSEKKKQGMEKMSH